MKEILLVVGRFIINGCTEVGNYKRKQELDQEKKKVFSFFLGRFLRRVLVFLIAFLVESLFSSFLTFLFSFINSPSGSKRGRQNAGPADGGRGERVSDGHQVGQILTRLEYLDA